MSYVCLWLFSSAEVHQGPIGYQCRLLGPRRRLGVGDGRFTVDHTMTFLEGLQRRTFPNGGGRSGYLGCKLIPKLGIILPKVRNSPGRSV